MQWHTECAAVIPCLNEAATIGPLVAAAGELFGCVIVVDDGSQDETARLARRAGARVHRHPRRQGKGAALLAGWRLAREGGFRWAMTLDGDGQHDPADIPDFLECADRTGAALVCGNRMGEAHKMPPVRRWVNRWMSRQLSQACARPIPDSQCGFRLVDLQALQALPIRARHFEIESEILLAFVRGGQRVEFVPIRVIYGKEQSKIDPLRDTWRWFRWWRTARAAVAP